MHWATCIVAVRGAIGVLGIQRMGSNHLLVLLLVFCWRSPATKYCRQDPLLNNPSGLSLHVFDFHLGMLVVASSRQDSWEPSQEQPAVILANHGDKGTHFLDIQITREATSSQAGGLLRRF